MEPSGLTESTTPSDYDYSSLLCENVAFVFTTFVTTILYSLVLLFGLVGNGLVLWVLIKYERLESLTNVFILNLCLSDLVFTCLLPVWIMPYYVDWVLGDILCKLLNLLFSISLYSSIIILTVMTIHRYLSVVSPLSTLRVHTLRCRVLVTWAIWAASLLSSIPDGLFHQVHNEKCDYSELKWHLISVYQHNIFFLLSMGIIFFCYVEILRTLFRTRSKRHRRTARLIFTIVMVYFLSWAPYNLILFLQTLLKLSIIQSCEVSQQLEYAMGIFRKLAFSHCCFNPVLYVFVGVKFRTHLKNLIRRVLFRRQQASSSYPIPPPTPGSFNHESTSFF
ncbi:PREDICTED: chemokine XC receptor 1 [Elephantulus edwardii]|uniref:chemokine XC receptor 1 n=1 Tax=Elephantulus edwardii TaxID=28737 RepID=UPI0003F0C8F8|nr:PREDICTED: chemokine XC receptor 1 [Elephantulus edwardii]